LNFSHYQHVRGVLRGLVELCAMKLVGYQAHDPFAPVEAVAVAVRAVGPFADAALR
jgi:hypothetical protein